MSAPNTPASVLSTQFFSKLANGQQKEAAEAATDYTRITLRDEGLLRKILPPETITWAQMDNQLNTDQPVKIVEKEVQTPLGVTVPFNTLSPNVELNWSKYPVHFAGLMTPNYIKDERLLKGWGTDVRNVFKDNAIKDMMQLEDVPFFALLNGIFKSHSDGTTADGQLGDTVAGNKPSRLTGKVQYYDWTIAGGNPLGLTSGFSRDAAIETLKILPKAHSLVNAGVATPIRTKPELCLMNINTAREYEKLTRDNIGGDLSQKFFQEGMTEGVLHGIKHVFTMKDDIVLDGEAYYFPAPEFLGKLYELEAPTLFMEKRAFMIEFFVYSMIGASIGNSLAVAKAKYF